MRFTDEPRRRRSTPDRGPIVADRAPGRRVPRREVLRALGLFGAASLVGACTPARIVMGWYPGEFKRDDRLVRRTLAGMADAIVPGSGLPEAELARPFFDERFPLHEFRGYLASDLAARSRDRFGDERFETLDRDDRVQVIDGGLSAGGTTRRLYEGAIFLTQLAFYAGIYEATGGCPQIDFDGAYHPVPPADLTYHDPARFLAREAGTNGNHA